MGIIKLIFAIVIIAFVFGGIIYLVSKNKRHAEKTELEKAVYSAKTSIGTSINDFISSSRTPEQIKKDLLAKIKTSKENLKNQFKEYLTELLTIIETHNKLIINNTGRIADLRRKAKEFKDRVAENPKYKDYADKVITQLIALQNVVETSKKIVADAQTKQEEAELNYDLMLSELETKHAEIISITSSPELSFKLNNIDIKDLTIEFKEKIAQKNIELQVSNIVNKTDESSVSISKTEIDAIYDSL